MRGVSSEDGAAYGVLVDCSGARQDGHARRTRSRGYFGVFVPCIGVAFNGGDGGGRSGYDGSPAVDRRFREEVSGDRRTCKGGQYRSRDHEERYYVWGAFCPVRILFGWDKCGSERWCVVGGRITFMGTAYSVLLCSFRLLGTFDRFVRDVIGLFLYVDDRRDGARRDVL